MIKVEYILLLRMNIMSAMHKLGEYMGDMFCNSKIHKHHIKCVLGYGNNYLQIQVAAYIILGLVQDD